VSGAGLETGLDYADQRYYTPGSGRFMTADPYQASAGAGDPGSWNRYSYVQGDPVNNVDPSGLITCPAEYGFDACVSNGYIGQPGLGTDPVDWCFDIANRFGNTARGFLETTSCGMWMTPGSPLLMAALMNPAQSDDASKFAASSSTGNARRDLAKKDCFEMLGFATATAAQAWFDNLRFMTV